MKRAVAMILVAGLAAAGCSSSKKVATTGPAASIQRATTTSSESSATTSAGPSPADALVRLSDLPTGWSQVPVTHPSGSCFADELNGVTDFSDKHEVSFQKGDLPDLDEVAVRTKDPGGTLAKVTTALSHCAAFDENSNGTTVHVTVAPMSFPPVGDASAAYAVTGSAKQNGLTITVEGYLVAVVKGNLFATVTYSDESPSIEDFQPLLDKAAARL